MSFGVVCDSFDKCALNYHVCIYVLSLIQTTKITLNVSQHKINA
jgi:hypothetical protein